VRVYVSVCMYVCVCVCMYICVHVCMHVCIYVCIFLDSGAVLSHYLTLYVLSLDGTQHGQMVSK